MCLVAVVAKNHKLSFAVAPHQAFVSFYTGTHDDKTSSVARYAQGAVSSFLSHTDRWLTTFSVLSGSGFYGEPGEDVSYHPWRNTPVLPRYGYEWAWSGRRSPSITQSEAMETPSVAFISLVACDSCRSRESNTTSESTLRP